MLPPDPDSEVILIAAVRRLEQLYRERAGDPDQYGEIWVGLRLKAGRAEIVLERTEKTTKP